MGGFEQDADAGSPCRLARRMWLGAALTLALPYGARAQGQERIARVGILQTWPATDFVDRLDAFKSALRERGHVEGRNIQFVFRSTDGRSADVGRLARELVEQKPDVVFAATTFAAVAVHAQTRQIPVVIAIAADPVGAKLVSTLARPGGNVTGMSSNNVELVPKRFQLLAEIIGGRPTRAAVLYAPDDPSNVLAVQQAQAAARRFGIDLRPVGVGDGKELPAAFSALRAEKIEMLLVAAGAVMDAHARTIAELAAQYRIPAMYAAPEFVDGGGLIAYSTDFVANFRAAAVYVDKILKGAKPADLPVEQSNRFVLAINRRAANALGLHIPQSLILQADRIVE